jgi:DNA polymerase III epsilon subunit-like protein
MSNSLEHFFGEQLVAVDTETTGTDPEKHEVWQWSIVPLNADMEPIDPVFDCYIKPERPEDADPAALRVNGSGYKKALLHGLTKEAALRYFEEWVKRLNLPYEKNGVVRKRMIPLGHNYIAFDKPFLESIMGKPMYENYFSHHPRDTMAVANFMNDHAVMNGKEYPWSKVGLESMCNKEGIETPNSHNSLWDCLATAKLYKRLTEMSLRV